MRLTPADLLDVFVPRAIDAGMSDEDARRVAGLSPANLDAVADDLAVGEAVLSVPI